MKCLHSKIFGLFAGLFAAAAFTFTGCSHSSSPSSSPPQVEDLTWRVPGVSSLYVETYSHAIGANSPDYSDGSWEVIENGIFEGKSSAIELINRNNTDTEYIAFESNGDYSILDTALGVSPAKWRRYPTGGGSPITQIADSTYLPDSVRFFDTTHVHKVFTRAYIRVENITDTNGVTYATRKVHELAMQVDSIMSFHNPSLPETTT